MKIDSPITECIELPSGILVAGEGGVGTQVKYRPYCGFKSRSPPLPVDYERLPDEDDD